MSAILIIFYVLAAITLSTAFLTIYSKNPIHSAIYLVICFFSIAGHYLLFNAQFLAIVHIIVYSGAIMVLFLFTIMLMNLNADTEPQKNRWMKLAGVIAGGSLMLVIIAALKDSDMKYQVAQVKGGDIGLIKNIGMVLFKEYLLPIQLIK